MRTVIGIDVGWSKSRKTCGIAANFAMDDSFKYAEVHLSAKSSAPIAWSVKCTLPDVVGWLSTLRQTGALGNTILVFDGPLFPGGVPAVPDHRYVDSYCQRGQFQNRCAPASLVGGSSSDFIDATYQMAMAAVDARHGAAYRHEPVAMDTQGAQLFETHPTVGMGVLIPLVHETQLLPSRKRKVTAEGRSYRAKSDWYWDHGAGQRISEAIGSDVSGCCCHERQAGLYCLSVGLQIAGSAADKSQPDWIGDPHTGIYCLAGPVHEDWHAVVSAGRR